MKPLKSLLVENPDKIEFNGYIVYHTALSAYPFGYFNYNILQKFILDFKSIINQETDKKDDTTVWYDDDAVFIKLSILCMDLKMELHKITKEPITSSDVIIVGEPGSNHNSFDFKIDSNIWSFMKMTQRILGRDFLKCVGRVFTDQKIISFWIHPSKSEMNKVIKDLEHKLAINIDSDWYIEIYLNGKFNQIPIDEYIGSERVSAEELSKKHTLSPSEKEKLGIKNDIKGFGSDKQSDISSKAGFQTYSELNNLRRTSESKIKSDYLIKEDPDNVIDGSKNLSYMSSGAMPFGYYSNSLLDEYLKIYDKIDDELNKPEINKKELSILKIELFDQMQEIKEKVNSSSYKVMQSSDELYLGSSNEIHGTMSELPFDPMSNELRLLRKKIKIGTRQLLKFTGRIWKYNQIISFWILPDKSTLHKIIQDFKSVYNIDINNDLWRIELIDGTLIPISEYDNTSVSVSKNFNKSHTLSPTEKEKKRLRDLEDKELKNIDYNSRKGFGSDKQGSLASTAGFTSYAQYNASKSTSESHIKLADLIK